METKKCCRRRYNLYYIFEEDRKNHPMPDKKAEHIRKKCQRILRKRKTGP